MARNADKERARKLRTQGKSYSEIKQALGIGKGTLSEWLRDMPLSRDQINQLRALNPIRIERYRETMRRKREAKIATAYQKAKRDIGTLSTREQFIAGLYLYWGEGTKAAPGRVELANTDPDMIRAFIDWMRCMGVAPSHLRFRLHLYVDMNVVAETKFWAQTLGVPETSFQRPYIKQSTLAGLTYKRGYAHGTCNARLENMVMWEYITMALKYIREQHIRP